MKLIDTVVLIAGINSTDKLHLKSREYLKELGSDQETFLPAPALIEFELALKIHGFNEDDRKTVFEDLLHLVPSTKILPQSLSAMLQALRLFKTGMSYFDSIITSMAKELGARVVTTDREIGKAVKTLW